MVEELTDRDSSEMPCGYDEDFVSPIDEDLQCSICYLPLREPVLSRCGHRFCRECLDRHIARQKSQQQVFNCPVDREGLTHCKDIFPDKATGRKILSLFIRCPSTGCDWTAELREKKVRNNANSFL
ncbi:unnamed protein product [Porites lobata]|uniref:RING-type domain-containing protein n=1 Tax=Porites lobata TaxID=104759 RepID=A0ABN8S3N3_9CNID|nr:unnamed protein product [Porites lobata]